MLNEVMQELEALGTAQNRKIYGRHGVGEPLFGVSYGHMRKLEKRLKGNHALALELWATGIHDARILAAGIADPAQVDETLLKQWVQDLQNYVLTDAFTALAARTPFAQTLAEAWIDDDGEWVGTAGWGLMSHLAMNDKTLPDDYFAALVSTIEREIHTRKNRVRYAMNNALISIGIRNEHLRDVATAAADRIGTVDVDHGQTSCKTPDAAAYIEKTLTHRRKKQAKKQAKKKAVAA